MQQIVTDVMEYTNIVLISKVNNRRWISVFAKFGHQKFSRYLHRDRTSFRKVLKEKRRFLTSIVSVGVCVPTYKTSNISTSQKVSFKCGYIMKNNLPWIFYIVQTTGKFWKSFFENLLNCDINYFTNTVFQGSYFACCFKFSFLSLGGLCFLSWKGLIL